MRRSRTILQSKAGGLLPVCCVAGPRRLKSQDAADEQTHAANQLLPPSGSIADFLAYRQEIRFNATLYPDFQFDIAAERLRTTPCSH